MTKKAYEQNNSLANIYEDVRNEIGFGLSLPSLMKDKKVWETDIEGNLKKAYRHCFRANSRLMNSVEKTGQLLLAELYIRDLVENLNCELADYPTQIDAAPSWQKDRLAHGNSQQETFVSTISVSVDDNIEEFPCSFSSKGTDVDVIVDHDTDANFFSDISYDLQQGGLFIATYNILEIGTRLNVRLVLPQKHWFILQGTVSWVREPENCADDISPGMGITFEKLSREPSRVIRRFMNERPPLLFEVA